MKKKRTPRLPPKLKGFRPETILLDDVLDDEPAPSRAATKAWFDRTVKTKPTKFVRNDWCPWCKVKTRQQLNENPCSEGGWDWRCDPCERLVDHPMVRG